VEDVSCASENILLAAHAMGLVAVWTSVYPEMRKVKGVSAALRLPGNLIPMSCILIGYPAESPQPKDKWDEEKITW
jgi:nitroreductase